LPGFNVLGGSGRSQAATMALEPGEATGGPDNTHPVSDQWVYVLSGDGYAVIDGERLDLAPGALVLIEAGEGHEIGASGEQPLIVLSVYAPPAYDE
jgi:mannose-6-phosphate isomerase-like protein (cupin superfamily)